MTGRTIKRGGIIAAGEGSRLGGDVPKALTPVAGAPLIAHVLRRYEDADIEKVVVIVRETDRAVGAWVEDHFPRLDPRIVVKTTPASSVSFCEVLRALGDGRSVISTVDTICRPASFQRFLDTAETLPSEGLVLAVTEHVDDEKPLWVDWRGDGRVTALGGGAGRGVTAGVYVAPAALLECMDTLPEAPPLRRLLASFFEAGGTTHAVSLDAALDVDRPEDVSAAEAFLSRSDVSPSRRRQG